MSDASKPVVVFEHGDVRVIVEGSVAVIEKHGEDALRAPRWNHVARFGLREGTGLSELVSALASAHAERAQRVYSEFDPAKHTVSDEELARLRKIEAAARAFMDPIAADPRFNLSGTALALRRALQEGRSDGA